MTEFKIGDRIQVRAEIITLDAKNGQAMVRVDGEPVGRIVAVPLAILEHADQILVGDYEITDMPANPSCHVNHDDIRTAPSDPIAEFNARKG